MTKYYIFTFLFLALISCKKEVCEKPISEIVMINKTNSFIGGKPHLIIRDSLEINKIVSVLNRLTKKDFANNVDVKQNYGFIEIFFTSKNCKNNRLMELVFTENTGDLIHYNSDGDFDYEYYTNQNLAELIKRKMGINENVKKVN